MHMVSTSSLILFTFLTAAFFVGALSGLLVATMLVAARRTEPEEGDFPEVWLCATDHDLELGATRNMVFSSAESAIRSRACVSHCGLVRAKVVELERWSPSRVQSRYWELVQDGYIKSDDSDQEVEQPAC